MPRSTFRLGAALAASALIGGLGATAANAAFDDVNENSRFGEQIESVQEAGIATGFPDGSFRPTEDLTRQQAAAWLNRSAARVGLDLSSGATITLDGATPIATVAEVEMTSPAAGSGSGWVTLHGGLGAMVVENGAECPCVALINLRNSADEIVGRSVLTVFDHGSGMAFASSPVFAAVPLDAGVTETYRLDVELLDPDVTIVVAGGLYGTYSPMAAGEPEQYSESSGSDPIESLIPVVTPEPTDAMETWRVLTLSVVRPTTKRHPTPIRRTQESLP